MLAAGDRARQRQPRGTERQAPNCPRCASTNTKFCYYNNYSLTQPRYFCKACRRYWTMGGSLRSVPVGGGCRRRRRSRPSKDHVNLQASPPYPSTSASDSCSSNGKAPNAQIDLAAVFAKYLDPGSPLKAHPVSAAEQGCAIGVDLPEQDYESFSHGMLQDGFWEPMVHLKELDSPPPESISGVMEDQYFQSNEALSDINWSCFDLQLQGYASSFQN